MPPFTVLHVCMGNICRSPMAERLLVLAAAQRLTRIEPGLPLDEILVSASAGTGGWHEGEPMNPAAARQIQLRGGTADGFVARKLTSAQLAEADLILTATADQSDYVHSLVPEATGRTFVLGHLGRLLRGPDQETPPAVWSGRDDFRAGAVELVRHADRLRKNSEPAITDDLDDPWGRGEQTFQRVADDISESLYPLVDRLLPRPAHRS